MSLESQYKNNLKKLLSDKSICKENKLLFEEFFKKQEYKLKRKRKLETLNDKVLKTLVGYIPRLRNVNSWFNNKPWVKLTKADIKKVYDDLEEGRIKNAKGKTFKDKSSYYNKVMKSAPFKLAGKDMIARDVIVATTQSAEEEDKEVRFIVEEDFKKALSVVIQPRHKLALWLGWDTTENLSTILLLKKKDCVKEIDPDTKEPEYNINFRKEILKTSRTKRTEPTLYRETFELLEIALAGKEADDFVFDFGKPALEKVWKRAVKLSKIRCKPDGQSPTIKDIRSGAACHLIGRGWTSDEIKSRMGHKPSSSVIDKYLNYKGIGKHKAKKKIRVFELEKLNEELEEIKKRERIAVKRFEAQQEEISTLVEVFNDLDLPVKVQDGKVIQLKGIVSKKPVFEIKRIKSKK